MNNSLISIITVVYNGVATLEKTILSVINQTYKNIEYIIIDGGSTDGTIEIIKKYKDKLAYWVSESDKGIYDAMNKGIKKATGELIGIINSDDWYELDCLETIIKYKNINDDNTVLYGLIRNITGQGCYEIYSCSPDYFFDKMPPHPTFFIPKPIYDKYGVFNIEYKYCSDYELLLRLKKQNINFYLIEKVLANFRIGGVSYLFKAKKESLIMRYKHGLISKKSKFIKIIASYFEIQISKRLSRQ
jgi:glycosyltransferase involved in cell wall biosynthesis